MKSNHGMEKNNLRNPEFSSEKDIMVLQHGAQVHYDDDDFNTLRANVIVLSYNRPRMLREALQSIVNQNYPDIAIHVCDDGSDFDVEELVNEIALESNRDFVLWSNPPITPEERVTTSRIGELINTVLESIPRGEIVYYLCDDDIMAPLWISRSIMALTYNTQYHVADGDVYSFNDGQDWSTESILGMNGINDEFTRSWWATGSFCHRSECFHDENLRWFDNEYNHSHDTNFIADIWELHSWYLILHVPCLFHREHEGAMSSKLGRKDDFGKYLREFEPPPATPDMVRGMMEVE